MKLDPPALPPASGFFLVWLCILYPGADHPPPCGFAGSWCSIWWLPLLVYQRVPTYADWRAARRPRRVLRVLRDGALAGLAFGTLALVFAAARAGGVVVAPGWEPVLVWLLVLTLVSAVNSALLYVLVSLAGGKSGNARAVRGRTPVASNCSTASLGAAGSKSPYL